MITNPKVTINQKNSDIQSGITWSSSPNKSFGNLSLLNVSDKESPNFATLELNEYELNGQLSKEIENVSFMSDSLSDDECFFGNVWVEGTLSSKKEVRAVYINFGVEYPKKIEIEYYEEDALIYTKLIDNISNESLSVISDFRNKISKIRLIFLESWAPYQYAHLQLFIIGDYVEFESDDIVDLKITESADPISNRLEINTAHIELLNKDNRFTIFNFENSINFFKQYSEIRIKVNIDGNEMQLGRYYIISIEFSENYNLILKCESFLKLMSESSYFSSKLLYLGEDPNFVPSQNDDCRLENLINDIFNVTFENFDIDPNKSSEYYEIDSSLKDKVCCGYIPITDCREALRQVCFNINAMVIEKRDGKISILPANNSSDNDIGYEPDYIVSKERVVSKEVFEELKGISSYSFTKMTYNLDTSNEINLFNGWSYRLYKAWNSFLNNKKGRPTRFDPSAVIVHTDRSCGINLVSRLADTWVEVYGYELKEEEQKIYIDVDAQNYEGKIQNIDFPKCNMFTFQTEDLLKKVYDFLNKHLLKMKIDYISTGELTGKIISVDLLDTRFDGILIRQTIDISGGMLSNAEILAV